MLLVSLLFTLLMIIVYNNLKQENDPGIFKSCPGVFSKLLPVFWVNILTTLVVFGGYLLFFIPGILLSIWLAFSLIIASIEDVSGMDALVKSREYTRDKWWAIVRKHIYLFLTFACVSIPIV